MQVALLQVDSGMHVRPAELQARQPQKRGPRAHGDRNRCDTAAGSLSPQGLCPEDTGLPLPPQEA